MGLYEDLLDRIRPVAESAGFPAALPASERDPWDMPRLSDLPQTLLPPHLGKKTLPAVDASSIGVQSALGNQLDTTPGLPAAFQTAGMLPSLNPNEPVGLTAAEKAAQALAGGGAPSAPVPMPQARPADASAEPLPEPAPMAAAPGSPAPPSATDFSSQSRAPLQIAPQAATPAPAVGMVNTSGASMFDRIRSTLGDNSNTLLALGAGFAGAPNWGQAISRAASAAIPARTADIQRGYGTKALIDAGVPVQQAIAAAGDPDLKKALIQNYITDRKNEIKSVKSKDAFGNETERLYAINPFDLTSKEITPAAAGAAHAAEIAAGGKNAVYAEGVTPTTFDHTKVGDEYLSQFSPEVQAGVKAYLRGDSLPTGRQQQAQVIKQIAQKYGEDTGTPANDQAYYQRKNFVTSLGNTNSGVGMQVKGFQQGLEHMSELASKLEKLGNWNGLGLEPVANAVNSVRGQTTSQADIRKGVDASAQALAGEIGKLYSGSSGGGVHERASTKALFGPNLSGPAMAGALESSLELMRGGLRTIEQRRDELFPSAEKPKGANFMGPQQQEAISKIESTIKRLRGDADTAMPAATSAPPPGKYMWNAATGKMVPLQ